MWASGETADALALGASESNLMRVRFPPRPPLINGDKLDIILKHLNYLAL